MTVIEGPDDAPVVVFAGSLGSTTAMWDAQAAALAGEFRVVRCDHRGHGGSPAPPGPYTVDELASDVLAQLDELGVERAAFVGLSLGGAVGQLLALRAPERIERLAVCCTSSHFGAPENWTDRAATVRDGGVAAVAPAVLERWLTPAAPPAMRERLEAMLLSVDPEGYAACSEAIARFDARGQLGALRLPVLAIAGSDDPATPPEWLEEIAAEVPGARLHVIEGARHIANVEFAAEFNRVLFPFLRGGAGMRVRREVLGDAHVDASIERTTAFTADFQDLITRYAWGEIWTRPGLDRRMRSAITLTALVAGGHENELAMHTRAALRNGLTADEIKEVLLQTAIYCGVPAANSAFAVARRVIDEEAK
jgi:3-oxoadipate enol-lactonase / 4-carboxymuconolactone decarboxylase